MKYRITSVYSNALSVGADILSYDLIVSPVSLFVLSSLTLQVFRESVLWEYQVSSNDLSVEAESISHVVRASIIHSLTFANHFLDSHIFT
jgi:hypothetical protein